MKILITEEQLKLIVESMELEAEADRVRGILAQPINLHKSLLFIFDGLEVRAIPEEYPRFIFFFKGDDFWMYYDIEKRAFWLNRDRIWKFFEKKFGGDYDTIKDITRGMLEKVFKLKGVTTYPEAMYNVKKVEKVFKTKGVTNPQ